MKGARLLEGLDASAGDHLTQQVQRACSETRGQGQERHVHLSVCVCVRVCLDCAAVT